MDFAEYSRMPFRKQPLRAAKYLHFRPFHVALDEIGRRCGSRELVQRDSLDLNGPSGTICGGLPGDIARAAIRRSFWVDTLKKHPRSYGPHRLFHHRYPPKWIPLNMLAQPRGNLR